MTIDEIHEICEKYGINDIDGNLYLMYKNYPLCRIKDCSNDQVTLYFPFLDNGNQANISDPIEAENKFRYLILQIKKIEEQIKLNDIKKDFE